MRKTFLASTLLVGVITVGGPTAWAQSQSQGLGLSSADLAITFTTERAKITPGTGDNFWMHGGSLDAGFGLFHGFGVAANVTAEHAGSIAPTVNLDMASVMAGPRYTFHLGGWHGSRLFVEGLFGGAHARDGVFPTATGVAPSANSFTWQVGGGWDIAIRKNIAIRLVEADYVRTGFPNAGNNTQDSLRLAFGLVYHIQGH